MPRPRKHPYHECKKDGMWACDAQDCGKRSSGQTYMAAHCRAIHSDLPPPEPHSKWWIFDPETQRYVCRVKCGKSYAGGRDATKHLRDCHRKDADRIAEEPEPDCQCEDPGSIESGSHRSYRNDEDGKHHCKAPGCSKSYSNASNAGRHFKDEHPKLEAEHVARQAQPTSQLEDAQPNRGSSQAQAQDIIAGPAAHIEQEDSYGQTSSIPQWSPQDGIDPRWLGPNSLSKRVPLTLRQQARYRMLYAA